MVRKRCIKATSQICHSPRFNMPTYEMTLLLRAATQSELLPIMRRTAISIFNRNGLIRSIENLGKRPTPYKMTAHGNTHRIANYFLIKFDTDTRAIIDLQEEYSRDLDIIRERIYKVKEPETVECTLDEELQPPAYRKDVKKMIKTGYKETNRYTHEFHYNTGYSYYPFQR